MADSVADKARKARERARKQNSNRGSTGSTDRLVMDLTRGKESLLDKIGGRYVNREEQRAANIMQQRRAIDTGKTAARATAIEKRVAKKKAANTLMAGVSGSAPKKAAPKPATKKAAAKPKTIGTGPNKAKVTPMPPAKKSEKGLPKTGRQNVKKAAQNKIKRGY